MTDVLVGGYYPVYVGLPKENHTEHDSITVDQGAVHIDAQDPEHVIRVKHDDGDGIDDGTEGIGDDSLRQALERLGANVITRSQR